MPTLAELARAGTLGAATAPLTDATAPVPPEITLAMLARAGLLGPAGGQYTTPGQTPPITAAAEMPRAELTNATSRPPAGPPPGFGLPPPTVFRRDEIAPNFQAQLDRERDEGISRSAREMVGVVGPGGGGQIPGAISRGVSELGRMLSRNPLRTGATTVGAITAASTGETQQSDPTVPNFTPMSREEFFRRNRTERTTLQAAESAAEAAVRNSQAYRDLIEERQTTRAERMITGAVTRAREAFTRSEAGRAGEDERLGRDYDTYVNSLGTQRDEFHRERTARVEAERLRRAGTPTRELYSDYMPYVPAATGLAALLMGGLARGRYQRNYNTEIQGLSDRWGNAVETARRARPGGRSAATSAAEARGLQEEYNALLASHRPRGPLNIPLPNAGTREALGWGAASGVVGGFLPEEIDFARAVAGQPLWRSLQENVVENWPNTLKRAGIAAGLGAGMAHLGAAPAGWFGSRPTPPGYGAATSALPPPRQPPGRGSVGPPPTVATPPPVTPPVVPTSPPITQPPPTTPPTATPPTTGTRQPSSTSRAPGANEWPEVEGYRIVGTGSSRRYQDVTNRNRFVSREELLNPHQRTDRNTRGQ